MNIFLLIFYYSEANSFTDWTNWMIISVSIRSWDYDKLGIDNIKQNNIAEMFNNVLS